MSDSKPTYEDLIKENQKLRKLILEKTAIDVTLLDSSIEFPVNKEMDQDDQELLKVREISQENEYNLIRGQQIASLGNWKLDVATMEVSGSQEFLKIFEIDSEELSIDSFANVVHPDDREFDLKHIKEGIEKGIPWDIEYRLLFKDGRIRWINAIGEPQLDENKEVCSIIGIVQDITERKIITEKLEQSEERISSIIKHSNEGISITNEEGKVIIWNYALELLTGINASETINKYIWDVKLLFLPEELRTEKARKQYEIVIRELLLTGKSDFLNKSIEREYFKPNGDKVFINGIVSVIKTAKGFLLVSTSSNITEQKKAEEALNKSTKLLNESQSIAKLGGWELDIETDELFWTAETYRIHDTSPEEFNPTIDAGVSYFLPESRLIISKAIEEAISKGESYNLELDTFTTKGRLIKIRTTCEPTIVNDKAVRLTGIFQDITEKKKIEKQLEESNELFRLAFNQQFQFMAVLSPEGRILQISDLPLEQQGGEREVVIGNFFWEMPTWQHSSEMQNKIKDQVLLASKMKEPLITEDSFTTIDGKLNTAQAAYTAIYNDDNSLIYILVQATDITDAKKLEDEMKESLVREKLLADIVRESVVGIAIGYPDGKLGMCNNAYQKITGYSEEELKIIDWNTVLTPPKWEKYEAAKLQELHKTKKPVKYEKEYIRKDDSIVPVELIVNPRFDSSGEVEYYFAFVIDIIDRKETEAKLIESRSRLDLALEGANAGLWSWNIKTGEDLLDERWCAILGYTKDEVKQHVSSWESLMHPDDKERVSEVLNAHFEDENNEFRAEYRMKCKNGRWKWILAVGKIVKRDINGEPEHMTGIILDIEEQKLAEEKNRNIEESLQNTFDISPSIICKVNVDSGYFIEVNKAVTRILGYSIAEFKSKQIIDFIHPDDKEKKNNMGEEQLLGKNAVSFENRYLCNDGSYKWMSWYATKPNDDNIVTAVASDVTNRKNAELELSKYRDNLEEIVKERTLNLEDKNEELERFNDLFVDREFRIKELKDEVNKLKNS